jgi:hypothetical protein
VQAEGLKENAIHASTSSIRLTAASFAVGLVTSYGRSVSFVKKAPIREILTNE